MKNNRPHMTLLAVFLLSLTFSCKKTDNNTEGVVTDIDGNVYHTVVIGRQVWMVENLKTTRYRNGDPIANVTGNTEWANIKTGAYCDYDNDPDNSITYGHLYNWYAVQDSRNIAPPGWRIPNDNDWKTLTTYLGGEDVAGGKLKETGFTALPGGFRYGKNNVSAPGHLRKSFSSLDGSYKVEMTITYSLGDCEFTEIDSNGYWWCLSTSTNDDAWHRTIGHFGNAVWRVQNECKGYGFSIRCIKDGSAYSF